VALVRVAVVPLNVTVLVAILVPKFVPVMVTAAPTAPEVGDKLVILGAGTTVKVFPLLALPATVTTTLPVVAPAGTFTMRMVAVALVTVAPVPLKFTRFDAGVVEKFVPVILTGAPMAPDVGERLAIVGNTVKLNPLVFTPLANTTTFPVVAPVGTVTPMLVAVQLFTVAAFPLKLTVPDPWGDPKYIPLIVTVDPTAPEAGNKPVMLGVGRTMKLTPLLLTPLADTTTLPVVAPAGTVATIVVLLALLRVAVVPLNVTALVAILVPKFVPVMVTTAPTAPEVSDKLVILGAGTTVKVFPLLALPATATTTLPVVAPAGTVTVRVVAVAVPTVAAVPLKVTEFDAGVVEKFVPMIVTGAPMAPDAGKRLPMVGAEARA
jgi:hypothetical protein